MTKGRRGAADLRDTGRDAGILTAGSPRARWIVANAPRYGYNFDEGYGVGEPWHARYMWDPWADAPGATPAPTPQPQALLEEDDMLALVIHANNGGRHQAFLGIGTFRHALGTDNPERMKNILRIQDDWQEIHITELPSYLRTFGCDLNIWDFRDVNGKSTTDQSRFAVLDPLTGSVAPGNVWTAANAARAEINRLSEKVATLAKPAV